VFKKVRSRLFVAVYLVLFVLAVLSLQVARNSSDAFLSSALLNVGTELIGVVLVFFVVDTFFLRKEWDLADRVEALIEQLQRSDRPPASQFFTGLPDIGPLIQQHSEIDMCGVSLTSTINRQLTAIREGVCQGKSFRIMIVDPGTDEIASDALKQAGARSEVGDITYYQTRLSATMRDLRFLLETVGPNGPELLSSRTPGSLQVRLLSYVPGFGIAGFDTRQPDGSIFIEVFPNHGGYASLAAFRLTENIDGIWYSNYRSQFEAMWQRAKPWPGADPPA